MRDMMWLSAINKATVLYIMFNLSFFVYDMFRVRGAIVGCRFPPSRSLIGGVR